MSASPQAMQDLLMQKLMQQQPQQQTAGGGVMGPQMVGQMGPLGAAGQLAQKVMLMRALQQRPPGTPPAPTVPPGALAPQTMNAQPVPTTGAALA